MRCFIAVDLSAEMRRPLVQLLRELPRTRDVRWCSEDQLHVTLKFLGEVGDERIARVCDVVRTVSAGRTPFAIRLSGLGCFPSPRNARVMWCGVEDPDGGCAAWVAAADPLLAELGFERETRAFTPHITLGRSKSRSGAAVIRQVLEGGSELPVAGMTVREIVLFESRLRPQGAQYLPVAKVPLGGA